ncbi:hypothetical protein N0V88_007550 [Collariella sp. IMI 366227]|nr:hypothetical protein N0V88_007550 [Collariella sp. IMI 366227]
MLLTTASTLAHRARSARALQSRALARENSAITHYCQQQTRAFRFGRLWSTCLDPCRRHNALRNKCAEDLIRRLSWQKHSVAEDTKERLKRMARTYWSKGEEPWNYWGKGHGWNYCHGDSMGGSTGWEVTGYENTASFSKKTPDNPDGVRPGQNIEDAERAPLEHFLFGDKKEQRRRNKKERKKQARQARQSSSWLAPLSIEDYIIDPITNRKVFKKGIDTAYSTPDNGVEIPVKKYHSQFGTFQAPESKEHPSVEDRPPPEKSHPDGGWENTAKTRRGHKPDWDRQSLLDTLNEEHQDVQWHKGDLVKPVSAPEYPDLDKYGPVRAHEPDGKYKAKSDSPVDEQELKKYGAFRSHEPDGKNTGQPSKANAAETSQYKPFLSHEPDGKYAANYTEEPDAAELAKYRKPFLSHEPDGKYACTSAGSNIEAAELAKYRTPFFSHEPDGKYAPSFKEPKGYSEVELSRYKAFRSHEPDGKYAPFFTKPEGYNEVELSRYKAFRSHEPDGKYAGSHAQEKPAAEELKIYGAFRSHEPDGKYTAGESAQKCDGDELARYGAFRSHEPDGKYASADTTSSRDKSELWKYKAFRSHEPDGKYVARDATQKSNRDELARYGAFRSHEPDGKYAAADTIARTEKSELGQYKAFRSHEPDGKYAPAVSATKEADDACNHEAFTYEDAETRPPSQETQPSKNAPDLERDRTVNLDDRKEPNGNSWDDYDPGELRKYQSVKWNEPDGKPAEQQAAGQILSDYDLKGETPSDGNGKTTFQELVDKLMAKAAAESDVSNTQAVASSKPETPKPLTGNYVRDFPEDFTKSWSTTQPSNSPLLSPEQKQHQPTSLVQPALDRLTTSPPPIQPHHHPTPQTQPTPSLYKILVWDPTMQTIETAETTSVVPDATSPLTPAEVLLRISNPAKFFPHFAPLQAKGFEIVAGKYRFVCGGFFKEEES